MDAFEKMIKTMREEAKKGVKLPSFGLAEMTGADSLIYHGMKFEADDILVADHLTKKRLTKLDFEIKREYPIEDTEHHYHKWEDKSEYIKPLKSGDVVFGFLINADDDEKFLVMCRVGGA